MAVYFFIKPLISFQSYRPMSPAFYSKIKEKGSAV
ncbi:hypothetical protein J2810_000546 [Chryseobacterium rhizosphaerae]|nr:hypothetical protein [Chryseobacterium rhizosphaerae]